MKRISLSVIVVLLLLLCGNLFSAESVIQSAREVPVVAEVDLLVIGGGTGGVAAACEASREGAKVMLVTSYPYIGEDRTATLRLSGESGEDVGDPLYSILENDPMRDRGETVVYSDMYRSPSKLEYSYKIEGKIDPSHPETDGKGRLGDGAFGDPVTDSLQLNGDAKLKVEFGEKKTVSEIVLLSYTRSEGTKPFEIGEVEFVPPTGTSGDFGTKFKIGKPLKIASNDGDVLTPITLVFEKPLSLESFELKITKRANRDRMLLAELFILSEKHEHSGGSEENIPKPPRPMHVKRTLENALRKENVLFLYNSFPVAEIRDPKSELRGAVIANRSGRQGIIAKKVLDTRPKIESLETAEFTVIGSNPVKIDLSKYPLLKEVKSEIRGRPFLAPRSVKTDPSDPENIIPANEYPIINYKFTLALPEGAKAGDIPLRTEIEKQIRLATFSVNQAFTADEIYYPQKFVPLSNWRAKGKALAKEATGITVAKTDSLTVVSGEKSNGGSKETVREILHGLRSYPGETEKTINDPERAIPVIAECDVLVVGGGTSGAPAGIAAARNGAKTLVLEHLHDLGGIGTAGAISVYWYGNVCGFTKEVQDGLRRWEIEHKTHWWRSKLAEANADVWYGVLAYGAVLEGDRVDGVLVATPNGAGIVKAKVIVDATGNGDIAVAAGAKTHYIDDIEVAVQGAGLAPRNLGSSYTNTDFMFVDENDILDSTHVFVYAKEKYPSAFEQGKLLSTRERRQVLGEFTFTALDQINGRTYPDAIVRGYSDYDTHGFTIDPYMELNHPHPDKYHAYVPYRSSIPKGLDGILVTGLAISSHRDALPIVRMQPDLQNHGYAIGYAASMLAKQPKLNVRKLDVQELQKHLVKIGNIDPAVASHSDNYGKDVDKLPDLVAELPKNFRKTVSIVMWYPEKSLPLVKEAYEKTDDFESKLIYAKVAAAMGDPIGVPSILEKLSTIDSWDKGWNFRGMGQAGAASSPIDQWIMMLARTGDPKAVDEIVRFTNMLTHKHDFSHHRAVAFALERLKGEKAVKALSDLLDKPEMCGYVHDTIEKTIEFERKGGLHNTNQEQTRRDAMIELSLARALYRCGDSNGKGEAILRAYTKDLRGHFSRHASAVLEEKR